MIGGKTNKILYVFGQYAQFFTVAVLDCHFSRVINVMKLIVQDEDIMSKEDVGILNRMTEFASQDDVFRIAAAKQLLAAIRRTVCYFILFFASELTERLVTACRAQQESDASTCDSAPCTHRSETDKIAGYRSFGVRQAIDNHRKSTVSADPPF